MSDYDFVQRGSLKLKGTSGEAGIKKKKKSKKSKNKDLEKAAEAATSTSSPTTTTGAEVVAGSSTSDDFYAKKTKAEIAFLKKKEERDVDRIRKKASVSHKERVEKFNEYLNSLSEHYEPAKVSWTK